MRGRLAVTALVVLAGGLVLLALDEPDAPPPAPQEPAAKPSGGKAREVERRRVEPPTSPAPEPEPPPAERDAPLPGDAEEMRQRLDEVTRDYLDSMAVPEAVTLRARELGVSADGLRAMYAAELVLHYRDGRPDDAGLVRAVDDALTLLAARGDEGFRAVLANTTGNPQNASRVDEMAKATWRPGLERDLIDWLEAKPPEVTVVAPLRALAGMDSPTTRDFLHRALERYEGHASNFAAAVRALATLGEGRFVEPIGRKLRAPHWSGVRHSLLDSLGRMGGDGARDVLIAYLRDPDGASESAALRALAKIDGTLARAEAEALLAEGGVNPLDSREREFVRRFLAE